MFSEKDVTKPSVFLCVFYMVIGFALSLVGFVAIPYNSSLGDHRSS